MFISKTISAVNKILYALNIQVLIVQLLYKFYSRYENVLCMHTFTNSYTMQLILFSWTSYISFLFLGEKSQYLQTIL